MPLTTLAEKFPTLTSQGFPLCLGIWSKRRLLSPRGISQPQSRAIAATGEHSVNHSFRNLATTPILKKRSRSEKAILGATLGIPGHSRSNSRNGSHDLIYVKTLFSEQLLERLSELVGRQNFSPHSRSVFFIPPRRCTVSSQCLSACANTRGMDRS